MDSNLYILFTIVVWFKDQKKSSLNRVNSEGLKLKFDVICEVNGKNYFGGTLFKDSYRDPRPSLCSLPSPDEMTVRQFWTFYSVQDLNSLSEIDNYCQVNSLFSSPIRRRQMFHRPLHSDLSLDFFGPRKS